MSRSDGAAVVVLGKGGVGKTMLTGTVSGLAAAAGLSTVAVDLDSTPSLTGWLVPNRDTSAASGTVAGVLSGEAKVGDALESIRSGFELVVGGTGLAMLEGTVDTSAVGSLVDELRAAYDLVVLDMRGGVASRMSAAFAHAADFAVVPFEPSPMGTPSLRLTRELLDGLGVPLAGIVPMRMNTRATIDRLHVEALQAAGFPIWPGVRRDTKAAEAVAAHELLDDYAPASRALEDFRAVTDRLLATVKEGQS